MALKPRIVIDTPQNFKKARKKFEAILRSFDSSRGRHFLAMQKPEKLKRMSDLLEAAAEEARTSDHWKDIERISEEVERERPDWVEV